MAGCGRLTRTRWARLCRKAEPAERVLRPLNRGRGSPPTEDRTAEARCQRRSGIAEAMTAIRRRKRTLDGQPFPKGVVRAATCVRRPARLKTLKGKAASRSLVALFLRCFRSEWKSRASVRRSQRNVQRSRAAHPTRGLSFSALHHVARRKPRGRCDTAEPIPERWVTGLLTRPSLDLTGFRDRFYSPGLGCLLATLAPQPPARLAILRARYAARAP